MIVDLEKRHEAARLWNAIEIAADEDCLHMNKGPIQITLRHGEQYIFRTCKGCKGRIPERQKGEREAYLKTKAPADSREDYKKD